MLSPRNRSLKLLATALAMSAALATYSTAGAQVVTCTAGFAGPYACENVDLLAVIPSWELSHALCELLDTPPGGVPMTGSDMWGWTDPASGREFAVHGLSDAVAFIEVTDPTAPVYLGCMAAPVLNFLWRDVKVYDHYAYVVGDLSPEVTPSLGPDTDDHHHGAHEPHGPTGHGLQIFDLSRLLTADPVVPTAFDHDARYDGFDESHNFVIDPQTGFAAAIASDTCGAEWHMLDLSADPLAPTFLGCYDSGLPGAVHDAWCEIYHGPDVEHQGKEICLGFMEDQFAIIDMSNTSSPQVLAGNLTYPGLGYVHQGVFTEDHAYVASNDELDELNAATGGNPHNTRTYMWDARDLDNPIFLGQYEGPTGSIDHNMYFKGNLLHQANYTAGYRVLDARDLPNGNLSQVAFFDTHPPDVDAAAFAGLWSGYFHFESSAVAVSQVDGGELFVLQPHLPTVGCGIGTEIFSDSFESQATDQWTLTRNPDGSLEVTDILPEPLDGSWAMKVGIESPPRPKEHWVVDRSPFLDNTDGGNPGVDSYCANVLFDPNSITLPTGKLIKILGARDTVRARMVELAIRGTGTGYEILGRARRDSGTFASLTATPLADAPTLLSIEWQRSDGTGNGIFRLRLDGIVAGQITDLDNDTMSLGEFGMGDLGLIAAGTSGELFFDGFSSGTLP